MSTRTKVRGGPVQKDAHSPPREVALVYRNLGLTHVFIAEEFRGFHVGGATLRAAMDNAIHALGKHITAVYGLEKPAQYTLQGTFDEFESQLQDADAPLNFSVVAQITPEKAAAMRTH